MAHNLQVGDVVRFTPGFEALHRNWIRKEPFYQHPPFRIRKVCISGHYIDLVNANDNIRKGPGADYFREITSLPPSGNNAMANKFQPGDYVRRVPEHPIPGCNLFRVVKYDGCSITGAVIMDVEYREGPNQGEETSKRYEKWFELDPYLTAIRRRRHPQTPEEREP